MSSTFKRLFGSFLTLMLALSFALTASPASASSEAKSYVIIARDNRLPAKLVEAVRANGGTITQAIPEIGVAVATSDNPMFADSAAKIAGVQAVVLNVTMQWLEPNEEQVVGVAVGDASASGASNPGLALQWGHTAVAALPAWEADARGAGVRVAVLDSGIDAEHPDIAPNLNTSLSKSFVSGEQYNIRPGTYFNHGTHVAGTIAAADNSVGTVGVAPDAEIVAVKVLSEVTGSGSFAGVAAGMVYAAKIDADIINMSLGGRLPSHRLCFPEGCLSANAVTELVNMMARAANYAYQQGTAVIASAGNSAIDRDHDNDQINLPSDLPNVLTISATGPEGWARNPNTNLDTPAFYTNYGQSVIDFAAPGGDVDFSLRPGGVANRANWPKCTVAGQTNECYVFDLVYSTISEGWGWAAGTSMAAPHASGVAALIIGQNGGSMHPAQVQAAMQAAADDLGKTGKDDFYGNGRVNAVNAVR